MQKNLLLFKNYPPSVDRQFGLPITEKYKLNSLNLAPFHLLNHVQYCKNYSKFKKIRITLTDYKWSNVPAVEHVEDREPTAVATINRRFPPFCGRRRHGALRRRPHHTIALRRKSASFSKKLIQCFSDNMSDVPLNITDLETLNERTFMCQRSTLFSKEASVTSRDSFTAKPWFISTSRTRRPTPHPLIFSFDF